VFTSLQISIRH